MDLWLQAIHRENENGRSMSVANTSSAVIGMPDNCACRPVT